MLCERDIIQKNIENEFKQQSKESRGGVLGQAGNQARKQAGKQACRQLGRQAGKQVSKQARKKASRQSLRGHSAMARECGEK